MSKLTTVQVELDAEQMRSLRGMVATVVGSQNAGAIRDETALMMAIDLAHARVNESGLADKIIAAAWDVVGSAAPTGDERDRVAIPCDAAAIDALAVALVAWKQAK